MLADEERRARIEVQLQGDAFLDLGITSVEELVGFRFEKLAKRYFSFWMATLPFSRADGSKVVSFANGWRRRAYWRLFAGMGVMGVFRRDQETMTMLKRSNESLPVEEKVMEKGKPKKHWVGAWTKEKDENGQPWLLGEHGFLVSYKALNERVRYALADLKL